jgi:hypothetical protein
MGSQFSSGPFRNVKDLVNHDLVRVKSIMFRYEKTVDRNFHETTFMTKKQFQYTLKLNDRQTYNLFARFDPDGFGRIPALDVFGALALASSANPGEKIGFCFILMDLDKDDHISKIDLLLLLQCVTRGFSKFKNIYFPTLKTLNTLVEHAFAVETNQLNERGDISIGDLRAFVLSDDLSRTYLANLGTEIAVVDTGKLVNQRAELAAKIGEIDNKIRILKLDAQAIEDDKIRYDLERGGDSSLVRLTGEAMAEFNRTKNLNADDNFESQMQAMKGQMAGGDVDVIDGSMTEAQRARRLARREESGAEENKPALNDALVFAQGCKPSQGKGMGVDKQFEQSMAYKWELIEPQSQDRMVKLDMDLVEDLFEAAGTSLTDNEALSALAAIKKNQLGRNSLKQLLGWYRNYRMNPPTLLVPEWRAWCRGLRAQFDESQQLIQKFVRLSKYQYEVKQ